MMTAMLANSIVNAVEQNDIVMVGEKSQQLVHALGGTARLSNMTPGAAAIYLIALLERRSIPPLQR